MSSNVADVIVVGAGPAGCSAAYDLLSAGHSVLLLDRVAFPRLKPCAGGLTVKTLQAVRFPLDSVIRTTCTRFVAGLRLEASRPLPGKTPLVAMTVRQEFDALHLSKCREQGADFRVIAPLKSVTRNGDEWLLQAGEHTYRSRFLVGADGANSMVRQLLGRGAHIRFGMALECCVPSNNFPQDELVIDFGIVDRGYGWVFPKGDHVNVGLYTLGKLTSARRLLYDYVEAKMGTSPTTDDGGHRIPYGGHLFDPSEDEARNLYFVGDAAGLIDPLLGEGIYNAIRSGQLAAEAIVARLAGAGSRCTYTHLIKEITGDLRAYWADTEGFYRNVDRGYRWLTMPGIRHGVVKGFALGLTIGRAKRLAPLLPFMRAPNLDRHFRPEPY